jgi:TolB-like protein/class 3 adenylate cyclase/Flp pilus assembly protein TadD
MRSKTIPERIQGNILFYMPETFLTLISLLYTMAHYRQLAAIMFTDIKGYSKMMEENEHEANLVREKMVHSVKEHVVAHQGRVVKFEGDGSLCIFNSSIEAVRAAISIQLEMKENPKIPLRIGINSGDVMLDEGEIYGDSVNVASRVESFAVPGGIFISGKVNADIKNQPDISTVSLGHYEFKNIKEPVELFAVSNSGIAVPDKHKIAGKGIAVTDKGIFSRRNFRRIVAGLLVIAALIFGYYKFFYTSLSALMRSVAVMPFENMNKDPESEFLSNGITEDILTQISRVGELNVISNSTMKLFKNSKKSVQEIGKELNAGSILEGSIRRIENKIRIFVQLIDAASGKNLWADTYDEDYSKIFEIQNTIAQNIASVLQAKLSPAEKERIKRKPTENLTAYEYYLKGRDFYTHYKKDDNEKAIERFKKAIELDRKYALAWAGLGDAYSQKYGRFGFDKSWIDSSKVAAANAIKLDSTSSEAYKALANAFNYANQYDKGFELLQTSVRLNPNNAPAVGNLGTGYFLRGDLPQSLKWEKKAAAINPKNNIPFQLIGWTYRLLGDFTNAELWLKKSLDLKPFKDSYRELAYTYLQVGKKNEAMAIVPKIIALDTTNKTSYEDAALVCLQAGDIKKAKAWFQKAVNMNTSLMTDASTFAPIGLGAILLKEGNKIDAEILLSRSLSLFLDEIQKGNQDDELRTGVAAILAIQGKKEEAQDWIQKAIDVNWLDYGLAETNPWFENINTYPRFKQMINTVKKKINDMRAKAEL